MGYLTLDETNFGGITLLNLQVFEIVVFVDDLHVFRDFDLSILDQLEMVIGLYHLVIVVIILIGFESVIIDVFSESFSTLQIIETDTVLSLVKCRIITLSKIEPAYHDII